MAVEKIWTLSVQAEAQWQSQFPDVQPVVRQLLWNRELRERDAIDQFLNPDYARDLHDPFLFKDMEKVVARLTRAIENKEKIFVYGDYDADGVTGSAILQSTLDKLGAITEVYMPHREKEGYGLNTGAVQYMATQNAKVIITNDCGISNAPEVDEANTRGMEVIVTDHHRIPEVIPKAYAILHPLLPGENYPNKFLTGGGVAFKLAQGLIKEATPRLSDGAIKLEEGFEKWLLDLVAISTVADVGILKGENRTLVRYGLMVLNKTRRIGLQQLMAAAGIKPGVLDTWSIGWQIAPRINAAGRMDHANNAFKLLSTADENEAAQLAAQLNQSNQLRQAETDRVLKEARSQIGDAENLPLIAVYHASWSAGVAGLVAGRLTDEFRKPVLVACKNEGGLIVGSARSIDQFNIVEALAAAREHILKFGGHPKAAGFSVADEYAWQHLIGALEERARVVLHEVDVRPELFIDADITLSQISWEMVQAVSALEPFGEGNPRPRFLIHGVKVLGFDSVGNNGKHLRLTVTDETGKAKKMIGFNCGKWCESLKVGDLLDVVVELGVNEWNGNREIELKIVDLRFHESSSD